MDTKAIIESVNQSMDMELPNALSLEELRERLATQLNSLANTDFNKLINLLYRLDIDEMKLRKKLSENSGLDAGNIIAEMVLKRQVEKFESRKKFGRWDGLTGEEEEW